MYAWVDGEKWGMDGCPALTEQHGWLADPVTGKEYGRILTASEAQAARRALKELYASPELELPLY